MKYESDILKRLINTYGVLGNPRYISEIIKEFIVRGKESFPNLFTYQADWLAHIDEFGLTPEYTVSYTGQQIYAPHTKEKPVKRAILKGQTLVNLINVKNATGGIAYTIKDLNLTHELPVGKYILLYDVVKTSTSNGLGRPDRHTPIVTFNDDTKIYQGFEGFNTSKGKKYWIIDATKPIIKVEYWLANLADDGEVDNLRLFAYQEGIENWDIPYFEGMQSVKMPALKTTGKNLFDINGDINQKYSNMLASPNPNLVNGTAIIASSNASSHHGKGQKIKVERGEVYTCSFSSTNGGIIEINTPLKLNYVENKASTFTFTAPTDCDEIIISFSTRGEEANGEIHNFQLEQGAAPTPYEPYQSNILTVNEEVELRGIGEVKDELNLLTGEVTQRVEEIVLDGSDITYTSNDSYMTEVSTAILTSAFSNCRIYHTIMCKDFPVYLSNEAIWEKGKGIVSGVSFVSTIWGFCIRLPHTLTGVTTADSEDTVKQKFKAYLQQNPITVQYQLATESIKTVDLTILDQNGQNVKQLMSFNGGTHFNTGSLEGSPIPTLTVDVVTDLEETLMVCSSEGNTM